MLISVLATGLAEAYAKDEAPEIGGFDISAGMFGPNVSDWVRSVAALLHEASDISGYVVTCVYCGHEYPAGTPAANHELLTAHIKTCDKHPMREAEAENARLLRVLKGVRPYVMEGSAYLSGSDDYPAVLSEYWEITV
jgi:hypothetical protein